MEPLPKDENDDSINLNPCGREKSNCTIFLGYTSNIISSGVRDTVKYLVQNNMVSITIELKMEWLYFFIYL